MRIITGGHPKSCVQCGTIQQTSKSLDIDRLDLSLSGKVALAFENLKAVLQAAGCTIDDIIGVSTFHTDPDNQFVDIMDVKATIFDQAPYPNWTAIGVNWLAGFDFEIKVIARAPAA